YGGEEFVLLLPETSAAQALAHAERLRAALEALAVPHEDSPNGVLTASVGVASTSERGFENWRALIEAADAALYTAKRAGRNRVAVWQPSVAREPQDAGPDL
ncbi:GGDEF domain-containing protein, partial [Paraburkholderia sp.]